MEKKLRRLFDFQKFENDPRLSKITEETLKMLPEELSDDALDSVAAAGDFTTGLKGDGEI